MTTPTHPDLLATLPPVHRLALAYAPAPARPAWLALLALDARLAGVVRSAREPVLGQLRLAWWRERLGEDAPPRGEPLLALLEGWGEHRAALVALVDGWEALLGEAPLDADVFAEFAKCRASAISSLSDLFSLSGADNDKVVRQAWHWALTDLAIHIKHPGERDTISSLLVGDLLKPPRLPGSMRPLVVLHGLARRQRQRGYAGGLSDMLTVMRLGIFGA